MASIIIPHYISSDMLKRLLSTIPDQENIQTEVVDNHSSDDAKLQLKEFQAANAKNNISFCENIT